MRSHTHRCSRCDNTWSCDGARVDDPDGYPPVVCRAEELAGTIMLLCEDCEEQDAAGEGEGESCP